MSASSSKEERQCQTLKVSWPAAHSMNVATVKRAGPCFLFSLQASHCHLHTCDALRNTSYVY